MLSAAVATTLSRYQPAQVSIANRIIRFPKNMSLSKDALLSAIHILFGVIQPKQLTVSTLTPEGTTPIN